MERLIETYVFFMSDVLYLFMLLMCIDGFIRYRVNVIYLFIFIQQYL